MVNSDLEQEAVLRLGPEQPQSPLVVSAPHAGRRYPAALFEQSSLSESQLRALEDRYTDRLVEPLADQGITVIIAQTARAWIDLNRSEREIDPEMIAPQPARKGLELTAKVRGGLGLVPRRLSGHGEIYRTSIEENELSSRISSVYRPYHDAVSDALDAARRRFGCAILLDCHSMPPLRSQNGHAPAHIVLGDRRGLSAAPAFATRASIICRKSGFRVARNEPYAGGHILARHGKPERDIHALQLEICRSLYLDAAREEAGPRFDEIAQLVGDIAHGLIEESLTHPESLAAE